VSRRLLDEAAALGRATAAGWAQLLFAESPVTGVLLLLGLVPLAPRAALMAAFAGVVATAIARLRDYPGSEWCRGLYGYAGALAGLFWGVLFAPGARAWLALAAAALVAAPLTRLAHRLLTPRQVPALALPALALTWLGWLVIDPAVPAPPPGPLAQTASWMLTLAGLALGSPLLALTAVVGAAVGAGAGTALAGAVVPGIVANAVPTAVALGAVLVPLSTPALVVAAVASGASGALWWLATTAVALPVPPLVAPFTVVTIAVVLALRVSGVRRRVPGRPAPLPLAAVGAPDAARRSWQARRQLHALASDARRIAALTGAGVSTEAGLPDFRGPSGLWARTARITLADFARSPEVRERHWREEERFFRLVERASPAAAHRALAELYRRGRLSGIVTQNVDGLHQAAGVPADAVIELHGSIREAFCLDCDLRIPRATLGSRIPLGAAALYCPECQGLLKGGSIMFGERVSAARLEAALRVVLAADLLLVLGTSLVVAPASDALRWARDAGIPIAVVNATPTPHDADATVSLAADVGATLVDLLDALPALPATPGVQRS
jgi:NAD-dependent deacetylase